MTIESLLTSVRGLPASVRIGAIAAISLALLVSIVAGIASHAPRASLFAAPLHPEQLREVEDELAAWNVPFTPSADNVIVQTAERNTLLLRLSLAGVPHAHVETTDEALANVGVLTPQSVVDAQARSGLAGDIEVGLRSISGVDDARVIVAPAKAGEFADESSRDASASVRLRLHSGVSLGHDAIAGIRHFVAASVAGLDPSHVTILDDRGIALDERAMQGGDGDALQRSLQSALDAALGPGAAIVRVHADYSEEAVERHDVKRLPATAMPLERTEDSEVYAGSGRHYEKRSEHDDRGTDLRETLSKSDPGGLVRVSTAVFVDESHRLDVPKVRELAAATVGYDAHRGDSLVVQAVDFSRAPEPKHDAWFLLYGAIVPLLPTLAIVFGGLAFVRSAIPSLVPIVKQLTEHSSFARRSKTIEGYAPAQVRGALAHEPPHAAAAIISALPAATAAAVLELYPQHEREAIVRRMQRATSPIVPGIDEVLGSHA